MKYWFLAFVLVGCGPKPPPCTPAAREALISLYKAAVDKAIGSGACDKYTHVEECPAYRIVEEHFAVAETAMCQGGVTK